ncbi:hypothetical protein [Maritalea sp.]|uniref:hypothetical protein n=1 Tax=Maritalea sp. TaxID=2003361 RepID=UPI003EF1C336
MEILFKREQTSGKMSRVNFKLWGKIELDEDEQAIVKRYRFDDAVMIDALQPKLLRNSALVSFVVLIPSISVFSPLGALGIALAFLAAGGAGYWYFNNKRETIFVKDLLHGRHFTCDSVVELARKEAWLHDVVSFLRQVMESAKHWDGAERHTVEALPREEARQAILRGG